MVVERYAVIIRGTRPYLMHRFAIEDSEITRKSGTKPDPKEEAEKALYKDEKGVICTPSKQLESALSKAGADFTFKGKKTFKDVMKSGLIIDPLMIPHKSQEYAVDLQAVVIQRGRIIRARPRFDKWELNFTIQVMDERITERQLKDILTSAGQYIGIGDYRPKYGLFEVVKMEKI